MLYHPLALFLRRVPGTDGGLNLPYGLFTRSASRRALSRFFGFRTESVFLKSFRLDPLQRFTEIFPDIPCQRLKGRHIYHIQLLLKLPSPCQSAQLVYEHQEG